MKKSGERWRNVMKSFSSKSFRNAFCLLIFLLSLGVEVVYAQSPYQANFTYDNNDPRHFDMVKEKYKDSFDEGLYYNVLVVLRENFIKEKDLWRADSVRDERDNFLFGLNEFIHEFQEIVNSDRGDLNNVEGGFFDMIAPSVTNETLRYYDDSEYKIILVSDSLNLKQAIDIRYRMNTLSRIVDEITKADRLNVEKSLTNLNNQWDNFHFNSKSQYPWEFLANSLILKRKRPIIKPPSTQLILAHPNISLELNTQDWNSLTANQIYNLEVIGLAKNFNNYSDYFSISLLASISNKFGNGYGGMVSYNGTQIGIVFHNSTGDRANIVLSLDLFKIFQNTEKQWSKLRE